MKQHDKELVLVVDDTPGNLKLMKAILQSNNYRVALAPDGPTALQKAKASPPNLILLDARMPGMDGYAVCRELKAQEETRDIPVIFVTALNDADDEARGFSLGAVDFIHKPFSLPVVLARVRMHLALYGQRRSLEGMFRDVVHFAPDAFILADTDGKIVQINVQAEKLFGYSRQELAGLPVEVLIPPHLRGGHERYRDGYIKQPHSQRMGAGVRCLRKDGSEFPAEINLSPLQTNRGRLMMAVVRDVTERKQAEMELGESRQRLRELAAQNEVAREGERKHIAREVHDELGQVLTALRMDLSLLGMQSGAQDAALLGKVQDMKGLVDRAILGVRNVAGNLRPAALDMGLVAAIEWLRDEFTRHTGTPCVFHVGQQGIELDETRSVVVFRIVQESLTNITRYAQASRVDIGIEQLDHALWLEVGDNGVGFDPMQVAKKKSYGLLGMHERAIALGGMVKISSTPGQGTRVEVTIPNDTDSAKDLP
jgi:PAS domain S-box-containing protein